MNKFSFLALTALLSFGSLASEDNGYCKGMSKVAGQIMEFRQQSVDMAELYELLKNSKGSLIILKMAYDVPLYSTDEYKLREIAKFKNEIFMICISKED
ncbi:MAG: hypothetical protein ACJASL_000114 [Paraglaciecola sp.]|jgi:hypothetical protein